jgi:hypothetical protein
MIEDVDGTVVCWRKGQIDKPTDGRAIPEGMFLSLPVEVQANILSLIAEIAESSYRRGVQHGVEAKIVVKASDWRFGPPGISRDAAHGRTMHAVERLTEQNRAVGRLFEQKAFEKAVRSKRGGAR